MSDPSITTYFKTKKLALGHLKYYKATKKRVVWNSNKKMWWICIETEPICPHNNKLEKCPVSTCQAAFLLSLKYESQIEYLPHEDDHPDKQEEILQDDYEGDIDPPDPWDGQEDDWDLYDRSIDDDDYDDIDDQLEEDDEYE